MANARTVISVDNVSKSFRLPHEKYSGLKQALINFRRHQRFETQRVIKDISFEVHEGEFFGIVGRNGSGKSTMLKLLATIYPPDSGVLTVNGTLTPFIELGVGFNPELTGRENVFLNGALLGFDRKQMAGMYDDIVEFAELEQFMDAKLKNYSSGMQVRLAFSVAIRVRSDILLLDEVLAVGDASFQRKCYDYFMELKRKKVTVVLVTHDMGAIRQYCDRAILIEDGVIMASGDAEKIAQRYQRLFIDRSDNVASDENENRWGDGQVKAVDVSVTTNPDAIRIESTFEVKDPVPSLVAGFSVYGPSGTNILEDNTKNKRLKLGPYKSGERLTLVWDIPNVFATGRYSVSVACCDDSTTRFYDWLNHANHFDVTKDYVTAGLVNPTIELVSLREQVTKGNH